MKHLMKAVGVFDLMYSKYAFGHGYVDEVMKEGTNHILTLVAGAKSDPSGLWEKMNMDYTFVRTPI